MRNLLLVLLVAYFSSCKKVYTCECYTTVRYYSNTDKRFYTEVIPGGKTEYALKLKRKKAEAACQHEEKAVESSFTNWYTNAGAYPFKDGESISTSCSLK